MKKQHYEVLVGQLLDDHLRLQLDELADLCHTSPTMIIELVEYGLLEPEGEQLEEWQFTGSTVKKIKTALRLQEDLEINLPGVVLAVEMLDELEQLRERINCLERKGR